MTQVIRLIMLGLQAFIGIMIAFNPHMDKDRGLRTMMVLWLIIIYMEMQK